MADVKYNRRHIFGDDSFKVTTGDNDYSDRYYGLQHDTTDARDLIYYGSKLVEHIDPLVMDDDGYFDLPADSAGHGFILLGDGTGYVDFVWNSSNTVTLISNTTNVDDADTDTYFCIFDNTSSVRVRNRLGSSVRVTFEYEYTETPIAPTFRVFNVLSGVDQLDASLTINSLTETPDIRYKGGDADGTDWNYWTYGEDLTLQTGVALPSYNQGSPCLGTNDDSVLFNTGDYYLSSLDATGDIASEDIVIELIYKVKESATNQTIVHHKNGGGEGWQIQDRSGYTCRLVIEDSATNTVNIESAALTVGTWNHVMFFVNRDEASTNGSQTYVNGVASGSGVDTSAVGSLTAAVKFAIGDANTTGAPFSSNVAYVTMWLRSSWHQAGVSGPAEWATIAAERFAKVAGFWPEIANGTYAPSTSTRAFNAYIDKVEGDYRKLYYVGSEWLRMCHRVDSNAESVRGYLAESQIQNLIIESEDFGTTWVLADAGDSINTDATACPDGRVVADSIRTDSSYGQHGVRISPTLTAATYTFSVFAKPGDKSWLRLNNSTVANCDCYFNVSTGAVGTAGAGCTGYMEGPFYGDFYRCCIVFTGTAAANSLQIRVTDGDTDVNLTGGDGLTDNMYFWNAQAEQADYMTSPIVTTGSALTRTKDQLEYVGGANIGGEDVGEGTIHVDVLLPDYDMADSYSVVSLSDGGSNLDMVQGTIRSGDTWITDTRATAGNDGDANGTVDVVDGVKHSLSILWETDNLVAYTDGADEVSDTSCDMPDDLDEINVGLTPGVTNQFMGLISKLRIYSTPTTKG